MEPSLELELLNDRLDAMTVQVELLRDHLEKERALTDRLHDLLELCLTDPGRTRTHVNEGCVLYEQARRA